MVILGIAAFYHDSSAAIMVDGKIVAAAQEERFSRIKHDNSFPTHACEYCLKESGLSIDDVDTVVFYEKPFLKFERILVSQIVSAPKSLPIFLRVMPVWLKEKLNMRKLMAKNLKRVFGKAPKRVEFVEHHLSHAALAYVSSGFSEADILVVDAVGEWATTSILHADESGIDIIKEQRFPDSVGFLYSAFTQFLGFKVNSDEYKVMGLAPYGDVNTEETQRFINLIETQIVSIDKQGFPTLNLKYFKFLYSDTTIHRENWERLFRIRQRASKEEVIQSHKNLAYAIQFVTEKILLNILQTSADFKSRNLCLSGGVALNCAATGVINKNGIFDRVFTPFAPGDCGCSIGAIAAYCIINQITLDRKISPYLGPQFDDKEILHQLESVGMEYHEFQSEEELCSEVARQIAEGKIIGWFQGRMEVGPRALGNRSILADARNPRMKDQVNSRIKFREAFRPFAPSVLEEYAREIFEGCDSSPYMMSTYEVKTKDIPAVTHIDGTARVQTVSKVDNPLYHQLLRSFHRLTGCPVLLNTSFNVMGEPIVGTPSDAIRTFKNCGLDSLFISNYMICK